MKGGLLPDKQAAPRLLRLELKSERELNVAFATGLGAGNLAEVAILLGIAWAVELWRVGYVEAFTAELQRHSLREVEVLEYGEVQCAGWGAGVALQTDIAFR